MNLACVAVPSVGENLIARSGLDGTWVGDCLPGELRECFARDGCAARGCAETVLLGVGRVPDPVHEEVRGEEEDEKRVAEGCKETPVRDALEVVG